MFFDGQQPGGLRVNRDNGNGTSSHPIHVGTDTDDGNGAYLSAGGVWTNGCSRTFKEDFTPIPGEELLEKIAALQIDAWRYINSTERHIGPVAEEFVAAFDVGTINENGTRDDKYLSNVDVYRSGYSFGLLDIFALYHFTYNFVVYAYAYRRTLLS